MPTQPPSEAKTGNRLRPHLMPQFRISQWLLLGLLCIIGLWLAMNRTPVVQPEFESISMASTQADYYLESFTLMSTQSNGHSEYTLSAESLIHLPAIAMARVSSPSLTVSGHSADNSRWELTADTGLLPDDQQTVVLLGKVQLQQRIGDQTPVRLSTPRLQLEPSKMLLSSDAGVHVQGPGWQLQADKMSGEIETGKLIFRDNNHVQYTSIQQAK